MRFRTKTILGIGLIETVLLVILVISSIGFLNRSNDEQIRSRAMTTAALFASTTKDAVLSTDLDSLQSHVDELLTNNEIVYVRVIGNDIVLAHGGDEQLLSLDFSADTSLDTINDEIFDAYARIEESGYEFGRVELGLSVAATTQLISEAWRWAASIATVEIILVAFFSFVLGTFLTRQLQQLSRASETIGREGPGYQLEYSGNDEIAQVSRSFNDMSKRLAETYDRLHASASEYRELAERLKESEARKSSMLLSALDGIVTINSDGLVEEFNAAAEEIFGYTANEVIGKSMQDFIIPEEYREAHQNGMAHWKETGEGPILGKRFEITARRKKGEHFPIELAITPVTVKDETIFTGFVRDITKQKDAELELRLAASAFDAQEGIFITDKDSRIIRANNAFTAITGFTHTDALGSKPALLFKSGQHDEAFYKQMWDQLIETGRWEGEIYNRRKNGEIYPEWLGISAVRGPDGEVANYIAHFIDISERKKFEEELVESRQKAETANIAKSQFLATMSHEIRTPLNGVIGMTDLLLKSDLQPKQKHMLRTANHSAQILLDIIKNILDFSKTESGGMTLEELPVSISEIVEETCEILAPVAQQKQVKLILLIHPKINYRVLSDPVRLHQILFNLSSNAIKFTQTNSIKEGRVIVKIEPGDDACEKDHVPIRIIVEDNGIGIKEKTLQHIFEPFAQAELSTTRQYGGSGLGLAITKRIVEAMNGRIAVESIYGTGTKFMIDLPLKPTDPSYHQEQSLLDKRILIIEAFSPLDRYLRDCLEQQGAIITQVASLEEARRQAINASHSGIAFDAIVVGTAWEADQQITWVESLRKDQPRIQVQFVLLADTLSHPDWALPGIRYVNSFPLLPSDLIFEVCAAVKHQPTDDYVQVRRTGSEAANRPVIAHPDVRILLVEDNEVNQDVIRLQLMELGFQAEIAADGIKGLEMFCQGDYDLVITDCHMPNMDGYELTREIRRAPGSKAKVPIIAISADSLGPQRRIWAAIGMDEYLTKPLRLDVLRATLSKHIEPASTGEVTSVTDTDKADVIFDKKALKELVGSAPLAVRNKLLDKFLRTAQISMDLLQSALQQREFEAIQREAHKLKSSAKAIGAFKLSQSCSVLELMCQQDDAESISDQISNTQQDFVEISAEISTSITTLDETVRQAANGNST